MFWNVIAFKFENIFIDRQTDRQTRHCYPECRWFQCWAWHLYRSSLELWHFAQCRPDKRGSSSEEGGEKGEIQHRNPPWWLGGFSPKLIPLVLEHFGFGGQEGQRFLHEISQRSRDEDGKANSIEFKKYWRRLFSMTLQRCNASVINRKLDRLSYSTASVGNLYRNQMYSR